MKRKLNVFRDFLFLSLLAPARVLLRHRLRLQDYYNFLILTLPFAGPRFIREDSLGNSVYARRVGNIFYTHAFAEMLFQEMILHNAKAGRRVSTNELAPLLSTSLFHQIVLKFPCVGQKRLATHDVERSTSRL